LHGAEAQLACAYSFTESAQACNGQNGQRAPFQETEYYFEEIRSRKYREDTIALQELVRYNAFRFEATQAQEKAR
jgi:hypothetical protein